MTIHITPIVLHVRGFEGDIDVNKPIYEMTEPYDFTCVVVINDDGVARLMGLDGTISHRDRRTLAVELKGYGVRRVEWKHKNKGHFLDLGGSE